MKAIPRTFIASALLAAGLTMLIWGWRGYIRVEQSTAESDDLGGLFCPPTAADLIDELELGLAAHKVACLGIATAGFLLAGCSTLSLFLKAAPGPTSP